MVPEPVAKRLEEKFTTTMTTTTPMTDEAERRRSRGRAAQCPRRRYQQPEAEQLLRRVLELIAGRPADAAVGVGDDQPDEVLELLEEALDRLPDELRAARWLLKEREEFLAKVAPRGRRHPRRRPGPGPSAWCSAPRS